MDEMRKKFYDKFFTSPHGDTETKVMKFHLKEKKDEFIEAIEGADKLSSSDSQYKYFLKQFKVIENEGNEKVYGRVYSDGVFHQHVFFEDLFDTLYSIDNQLNHDKRKLKDAIRSKYDNIPTCLVEWYQNNICDVCSKTFFRKRKSISHQKLSGNNKRKISEFMLDFNAVQKFRQYKIDNDERKEIDEGY